jgi:hypothetical protein
MARSGIGVLASAQQGDLVISAVPTGVPIKINPTPTIDGDGNALGITPNELQRTSAFDTGGS